VSAANSHHDTAGERPHLSIGEVLGLLQEDYPDITISKIRFLESQGLLDPERTPSGYRKFHDEDVEQLRWVLRQQKENFLPLKVIKDRLAAGRLDEPASASGLLDLAVEPRADTDTDTSVPTPDASRNGSHPPVAEAAPTQVLSTPEPPGGSAPVLGGSVTMSATELCRATGISPRLLGELEALGLVAASALGSDAVYGDEAVVICRIACEMTAAGLEARHLRMFKVAADREAGLYEQLVMPVLRSRRPDARQEAVTSITSLSESADRLHGLLLRRALRDTLGPI
jgi:DNA-binding transcriptional MerR regulator